MTSMDSDEDARNDKRAVDSSESDGKTGDILERAVSGFVRPRTDAPNPEEREERRWENDAEQRSSPPTGR